MAIEILTAYGEDQTRAYNILTMTLVNSQFSNFKSPISMITSLFCRYYLIGKAIIPTALKATALPVCAQEHTNHRSGGRIRNSDTTAGQTASQHTQTASP